jgi:hypothetical protein
MELDLEITDQLSAKLLLDKARKKHKRTKHEDALEWAIKAHGFPAFVRELRFAQSIGRRWRFDFAWPEWKLALEVEGLAVRRLHGELVVQGRHASITGMREDMHKYNAAAVLGWSVLRAEQAMIKSGEAIEAVGKWFASRGWNR